MLTGIIATARQGVIGRGGRLPWHLPEDLKRFRDLTWNGQVLMGRRTFESLGRWLPNRTHLILSRDPFYRPIYGAAPLGSEYIVVTEQDIPTLIQAPEEIFVAGGAEIYARTLPHLTKLHWTYIHADIEGDVKVDMAQVRRWNPQIVSDHPAQGDQPRFTFLELTPP